jgi:anti-sigma factor RsiW
MARLAQHDRRRISPVGRAREWFGRRRWRNAAAVFASALAAAWSVAIYLALPSASDALAEEVVSGHVRSLMANHIADLASSDRGTGKPWFNGKFAPAVRDYAAQGFQLVGGRLDYLDHRPVAALVYRHGQHSITVYIWPAADGRVEAARTLSRQGYQLAHCAERGMTYWAVSDVDPHELMQLVAILQSEARLHPGSASDARPMS